MPKLYRLSSYFEPSLCIFQCPSARLPQTLRAMLLYMVPMSVLLDIQGLSISALRALSPWEGAKGRPKDRLGKKQAKHET